MALINVTNFEGKVAKVSSKLIRDTQATTATNVEKDSGQLNPMLNTSKDSDVPGIYVTEDSSVNYTASTAYKAGDIVYYSTDDLNYICHKDHTSPSTLVTPPDLKWNPVKLNTIASGGVAEVTGLVCGYPTSSTGFTLLAFYTHYLNGVVYGSKAGSSGTRDYPYMADIDGGAFVSGNSFYGYQTNPAQINISVNHGLLTNDSVTFLGTAQSPFTDWQVLSGNTYTITKISDTTFSIPINATSFMEGPVTGLFTSERGTSVARKIKTAVDSYTSSSAFVGLFASTALSTTTYTNDTLSITYKYKGSVTDASTGLTGGSISATTQGVAPTYNTDLTVQTIYKLNDTWLNWDSDVDIVESFVAGNDYKVYYTGDSYPKQTTYTDAISGTQYERPNTYYRLGVETPATSATATVNTGGGNIDTNFTTSYVYTYITSDGAESAPSPVSSEVTVVIGDDVTISSMAAPVNQFHNIVGVRIYRTNTGDNLSEFQLVNSTDVTFSGTTGEPNNYTDDINASDLGSTLITEGFDDTEDTLKGITVFSEGVYAAFKGNTIYFNEPFYAYAWPVEYTKELQGDEDSLIGLGSIGGGIIACTNSYPHYFSGMNPASIQDQTLPYFQPCKSKRSITSSKVGVTYASSDGLFMISQDGAGINLTENIFSKTQWNTYDLTNLVGVYHDNKYYGFFNGGTTGFIYDYNSPDNIIEFNTSGRTYKYAYSDGYTLWVLVNDTTSGDDEIHSFEGASTYTQFTWISKTFQFFQWTNFGVCRIIGSGVDATYPLSFKLYSDGVLKHTESITSLDRVFRLPGGYRGKAFYFTLTNTTGNSTATKIDAVQIANNVSELRV